MEYCLETQALCKTYGRFRAVDNLSMHVPRGAIYGFVGKNGAGKTTLLRLICGLQRPTAGGYCLYGVPHTDKALCAVRRRMGAVVETPSIYMDLPAQENLKQQYRVLGLPSFSGIPALLELVGLQDTGRKKARHFSLGMRQRLGIAMALAGDPDFLVLDEPTNGLDPQGIIEVRELILKLNREFGITVLISSHILGELSKLATHYGFIDGGRIVFAVEKDAITDFAGVAQCRAAEFDAVVDSGFFAPGTLHFERSAYGTAVLVPDRLAFAARFPQIVLDRADIDAYMSLMLKGDVR